MHSLVCDTKWALNNLSSSKTALLPDYHQQMATPNTSHFPYMQLPQNVYTSYRQFQRKPTAVWKWNFVLQSVIMRSCCPSAQTASLHLKRVGGYWQYSTPFTLSYTWHWKRVNVSFTLQTLWTPKRDPRFTLNQLVRTTVRRENYFHFQRKEIEFLGCQACVNY